MKKQQRNYTVLLIKDDNSSIKKVVIKEKTFQLALFFSFIFILILSLFLTDYVNIHVDQLKISRLEKENQNWGQKLSYLELQVKELEDQVQQSNQFSKKISLITNNNFEKNFNIFKSIGKIHSDSTLAALSTPTEFQKAKRLPASTEKIASVKSFSQTGELELRIEKLKGQAELAKQDSWNLYTSLLETEELLNSTPSRLPVKGWISSHFGYRTESIYTDHEPRFHKGMDIAAAEGVPVGSTATGKVTFTGYDDSGFGNLIIIDHGYGLETYYGHLSKIIATAGQTVKKGDVIGEVGSTGKSSGPHLHYEVRIYGEPVNPINYILDYSPEIVSLHTHSH